MENLQYPIGKPQYFENVTDEQRAAWIEEFSHAPAQLEAGVAGLSDEQLDTPYRPGGWTVRQVCHHLPDSHSNGYVRTKLALTEDSPIIKPYAEDQWAKLPDSTLAIGIALDHYRTLQARWTAVWKNVQGKQWARTYIHPEYMNHYSLDQMLQLYTWHGKHHLAQITSLKTRMNWE